MDEIHTSTTEPLDITDSKPILKKFSAVNNKVRFSILEILGDFQRINMNENNEFIKDPLYSREINELLINNYNIEITPQMLGQHLKKLQNAGLIEEITVKKEVPNKVGYRSVNAYYIKLDAFENLLLEVNFLSDELNSFIKLIEHNQKFYESDYCVLTVFNGKDRGKTFKIHKNNTVFIGRRADFKAHDVSSFSILLDNSYSTVSSIAKPHIKIFYENGVWNVLDEASTNGTYISDKKISKRKATKLRNNSFIKLSKGTGSAILYCSI